MWLSKTGKNRTRLQPWNLLYIPSVTWEQLYLISPHLLQILVPVQHVKSINLYVELLTSSREIKLKYEDIQTLVSICTNVSLKKKIHCGLPWWLSGKESACLCRRHGFDPWSRKILHAIEQLIPCTTTVEPMLYSPGTATTEPLCHNYWRPSALEPVLHKRSCRNEKPAQHN